MHSHEPKKLQTAECPAEDFTESASDLSLKNLCPDSFRSIKADADFDVSIPSSTWETLTDLGYWDIFSDKLDEAVEQCCLRLEHFDLPINESNLTGIIKIRALVDFDSPDIPSCFEWDCFQLKERYVVRVKPISEPDT